MDSEFGRTIYDVTPIFEDAVSVFIPNIVNHLERCEGARILVRRNRQIPGLNWKFSRFL